MKKAILAGIATFVVGFSVGTALLVFLYRRTVRAMGVVV